MNTQDTFKIYADLIEILSRLNMEIYAFKRTAGSVLFYIL